MTKLIDIIETVSKCQFGDWFLAVKIDQDRPYLQVIAETENNSNSKETLSWSGRKWFLSFHMTKSEIVQTVFKAVMTAMEHETREKFKYKGVSVFDPHINVDHLVDLHKQGKALEVRT